MNATSFLIVIDDENRTIKDLDVRIDAMGFEGVGICFGACCFQFLFLSIAGTGLVFLFLAMLARKKEKEIERSRSRRPYPPNRFEMNRSFDPRNGRSMPSRADHSTKPGSNYNNWGTGDYWERKGVGRW